MEEKRIFHVTNRNTDGDDYIKLSENEYALLKWLDDNCYLDDDTSFDEVPALPTPLEFS